MVVSDQEGKKDMKKNMLDLLAAPPARSAETIQILLFDRLGKSYNVERRPKLGRKYLKPPYAGDPKVLLHLSSCLFPFTGYH